MNCGISSFPLAGAGKDDLVRKELASFTAQEKVRKLIEKCESEAKKPENAKYKLTLGGIVPMTIGLWGPAGQFFLINVKTPRECEGPVELRADGHCRGGG